MPAPLSCDVKQTYIILYIIIQGSEDKTLQFPHTSRTRDNKRDSLVREDRWSEKRAKKVFYVKVEKPFVNGGRHTPTMPSFHSSPRELTTVHTWTHVTLTTVVHT